MATIKATIMSNPIGKWYIELYDVEKDIKEYCLDFDEFETKIAQLGEPYSGDIKVEWSADKNVTKEQINEIRMNMIAYEQKVKQEDEELNSQI